MRQKSVTFKTVNKYINFLNAIKNHNKDHKLPTPIEQLVADFNINKTIIKALEVLNIIKRNSKTSWEWLADEPDKKMALTILDYLLHLKKPQQPALLPEYITQITSLLKEISEKLTPHQTIEESGEKGLKISDRIYLAGQIASAVYGEFGINTTGITDPAIKTTNDTILFITDNLLSKINGK